MGSLIFFVHAVSADEFWHWSIGNTSDTVAHKKVKRTTASGEFTKSGVLVVNNCETLR